MKMNFPIGKDDLFNDSASALKHIESMNYTNLKINPECLHVVNDGKTLCLEIFDGKVKQVQMRQSFMLKLLKWFNFPSHQLDILDIDTVTSILNDYLLAIKRIYVNVKLEYEEALTITSDKYCEVEDTEVIKRLDPTSIDHIYFTDFSTYIRTKTKFDIQPFKGDTFGVGLNIVNSETGFKAFQINNYLLRYVCSNGAYVTDYEDDKKYYHYDLFVPNVYDIIRSRVESLKERAIEIEIKLKNLTGELNKSELHKIILNMHRKIGVKFLIDLLETDRLPTKYELFNIITDRAKDFSISKRILIEEVAGGFI
jgi:hypothetical protein